MMSLTFGLFTQVSGSEPLGPLVQEGQLSVTGFGWLVGFGFNGPLRQYFSLYRAVSQEREKEGRKDS